MPIVTDNYMLSLTQDNRILRVRCSQNDTSRQVKFTIYNNGTPFIIPSGLSVSVHGIKQNGNIFTKSCSYSGSVVTLVLGTQITDIAGISVAELVFTDSSGGKIGTSNFIFQVESDPLLRGAISVTEETPTEYISDLISMVEALSARVNNIIAPSGEASLSEIVDARLSGYSGTTYQNLKARIDTDFAALNSTKVNLPFNGYGASGKVLRSTGTGTEWATVGQPTDAQTAEVISNWLDEHPEATTTVLDGSLTETKLSDELKEKVVHNYVTPQMYGAKADGITDDAIAIQNALNYLNTRGGGIIYFPVGTYLINSSVQSYPNIIITGEGNGSVIKIGVSEVSLITANNNVVKNLGFDGNATVISGSPTRNTILSARGTNVIVKDCYFSDAIGSCVASSAGNNVKVLHNTMNGYGDHAVYFSTDSSNIVVSHNIISRPNADRGSEAIKFRKGVNNICVVNNIAENVPCFIFISEETSACKNAVIIGNHVTTTTSAVIISSVEQGIYNEYVLISNNVFENISGDHDALTLTKNSIPGCRNVIISNNVFKNFNGVGAIQGTEGNPIENIGVINNIFDFGNHLTNIGIVLNRAKNLRYIGNTFVASKLMTTFITTRVGAECEFNGNYFNLECTWLFTFENRSDIKIMFTGNTIKRLSRRLINNGNITGNSLIVIKDNNILDDSTSYPYFYDRSSVSDPTKYLIKDNIVNGADYNPSMITYIPSYVGQMCVNNGVVYVAVGTTATTDWIALNATA